MKKILIIISFIMVSFSCKSDSIGDLDTSFASQANASSNWNGWLSSSNINIESYIYKTVIDSMGRILIIGMYREVGTNDSYRVYIHRLLADGNLDIIVEAGLVDPILLTDDFTLGLTLADDDGFFYSRPTLTCETGNTSCHQDILVTGYDNTGNNNSNVRVLGFDLGSTYERQNDRLVDLMYIKSLKKLVIIAEVERTGVNDTDYGIAVYDVNVNNSTITSNFGIESQASCFFDQSFAEPIDIPQSVVYVPAPANSLIIGGSSFEGNGINNDGWNVSFCEFNLDGDLVRRWSSGVLSDVADDREIMQDMELIDGAIPTLVIAAQVPNSNGKMDFGILQYQWDSINDIWSQDTSFGSNIPGERAGFSHVGFNQMNIGETNDILEVIKIEQNGSIIVAGNSYWMENTNQLSHVSMAKFNNFGILDTSWGNMGTTQFNFNSNNDKLTSMALDQDIKEIYITGNHTIDGNTAYFIANILNNPDLIFKNSFVMTRTQ